MSLLRAAAIAWRYTFALRRGHLAGFLSLLSMLGIALAVALLITVLSVMNGFDREMRERILALVPHIVLHAVNGVDRPQLVQAALVGHPQLRSVRPFAEVLGMLVNGRTLETAAVTGVDDIATLPLSLEVLDAPARSCFAADPGVSVLLGVELAARLRLQPGDVVQLLVPASSDVGGRAPSLSDLRYCGALRTQTELDQTAALLDLVAVSRLAGLDGRPAGFHIAVQDLFDVRATARELLDPLGPLFYATNWIQTHGNLYSAIQLSRNLVSFLLLSIIAIAAFNVVSSLVLVVLNKRSDIAILRTLGATPGFIATIFLLQGLFIGALGIAAGTALGLLLTRHVTALVAQIERWSGVQFLNTDVYPISFLPVDLRNEDVLLIGSVSLLMCLLAAVYPALRAARSQVARVLAGD